jgi:hypothetical protein
MSKMDDMIDGGGAEEALAESESQSTALDIYQGEAQFTSEDVFIPRLRLAQGLTSEVQDGTARPGQFLVSGFAPEEDVTLVPVGFARLREYRDPEDGSVILCYSKDAITGEGDPGGECGDCPNNKWVENPDKPGKNLPPVCKFSYGYLFYSEQHDTIVSFKFKGMALNAGKMLNTVVNHHGLRKVAITLSSEQRSGKVSLQSMMMLC